jgi:hypothetical protein
MKVTLKTFGAAFVFTRVKTRFQYKYKLVFNKYKLVFTRVKTKAALLSNIKYCLLHYYLYNVSYNEQHHMRDIISPARSPEEESLEEHRNPSTTNNNRWR